MGSALLFLQRMLCGFERAGTANSSVLVGSKGRLGEGARALRVTQETQRTDALTRRNARGVNNALVTIKPDPSRGFN